MRKILLLLFMLVVLLVSCEEISYLDVDYLITFETNGGTLIESIEVKLEGEIIEPLEPTKEGFVFSGWYSDIEFTNTFDFPSVAYSDLTLYVKWTLEVEDEPESDIDLSGLPYFEYLDESNPVITIVVKDIGVMTLELFPSVAPNTVNNFIMYIENGDFTNNSFHRVIEDFMIQGGNTYSTHCPINGDFLSNGFTNDLSHFKGVISMARTGFMDSATSQFFIMHGNLKINHLDGEYAAFGGLVDGFDVLDYIALVDTSSSDAPLETIIIDSITVELNGYIVTDRICAD